LRRRCLQDHAAVLGAERLVDVGQQAGAPPDLIGNGDLSLAGDAHRRLFRARKPGFLLQAAERAGARRAVSGCPASWCRQSSALKGSWISGSVVAIFRAECGVRMLKEAT
jgi:hypothetical protein